MIFRIIPSLAILFFTFTLSALDATKSVSQYTVDSWTERDGLPGNQIVSTVQASDGYIWIAEERTIFSFDGEKFRLFNSKTNPEMKNVVIKGIVPHHREGLWVATHTGIFRFHGGKLVKQHWFSHYDHLRIKSIETDRDGRLWVGTAQMGLFSYMPGEFQNYTTENGLPDNNIRKIEAGRDGRLWFTTTGNKIGFILDHKIRLIPSPQSTVSNIFEDKKGRLWIGTENLGAFIYNGTDLTAVDQEKGLPGLSVESFGEDSEENIWIGTGGGFLSRYGKDRIDSSEPLGGSSAFISDIFEDREKNLWVSIYAYGILRFKNGIGKLYGKDKGLNGETVSVLYESKKGGILAGTLGGGLNMFEKGDVRNIDLSKKIPFPARYASMTEDRSGGLWFGIGGTGLVHKRGKIETLYTKKDHPWLNDVFSITEDSSGKLWIGTEEGVLVFENNSFMPFGVDSGVNGQTIRGIHEDRDGNIWILGNKRGVFIFRKGHIENITTKNGLSGNNILAIMEEGDGTIWITTCGFGLTRYKDGKLLKITEENGLPDNLVYNILRDDNGDYWLSFNSGIARIRKDEMSRFLEGKTARLMHELFRSSDGLVEENMVGGTQHNAIKRSDGALFFATTGGILVLDPTDIPANDVVPPVYIEKVVTGMENMSFFNSSDNKITLSPGVSKMEIHYTGIGLTQPGKMRFMYRLEGFDREWVDAGGRRIAYYTNVPPGEYVFRVKAANNDGIWNKEGGKISIEIKPFLYETLLFKLAIIAAMILLTIFLFYLKIRSVKRRERDMMHADRLTSLGILVSGVAHEINNPNSYIKLNGQFLEDLWRDIRPVLDDYSSEKGDFSVSGAYYTDLKEDIPGIIRGIGDGSERITSIVETLKGFSRKDQGSKTTDVEINEVVEKALTILGAFIKTSTDAFNFRAGEGIPKIRGNIHHLEQVVVNLVTNACQSLSSKSASVTVSTSFDSTSKEVHLTVSDEGCGVSRKDLKYIFDPFFTTKRNDGGTGLGLAVTYNIVKAHNGTIRFDSVEGRGTTVDVSFSPE